MKVQWNNCFLCLNDLGYHSGSSNELAHLKVLFKYLLDTRNKAHHHNELENVLDTMSTTGLVKLCEACEILLSTVVKLHLQLEVVQMKLINEIREVREIVLKNSKIYGTNQATRMGLEVFEAWLIEQEGKGEAHQTERQLLKSLYAFQTAVFEKGNVKQYFSFFCKKN